MEATDPTTDLSGQAPTVAINTSLLPTMAQHCTRCGAQLAPDQRYCVECGERRGEPRLPFMDGRTAVRQPVAVAEAPVAPPPAVRSRWGSGGTLIAGVVTLLVALGVGVLIGSVGKGDGGNVAAAAPPVITVQGAAGTGPAATTTTAAQKDSDSDTGAEDDGKSAAKEAKPDKSREDGQKAAKTAVSAPGGGEVPQAAEPVVEKGQKGTGPGYKDGKFTGDFFGQ